MRDLGFAFNDKDFSDRVLHVEIEPEFIDLTSDSEESDLDNDIEFKENKNSNKRQKREEVVKVKTMNVSSLVLAANSPFFYKLFKNGMKESHEKEVTMRINASEEASLMELLNFMYKNTLNATTTLDLENVLTIANKYEVTSCMAYCSKLLKDMPLSLESTLLYLELPSCKAIQPLKDAAKKYLIDNFKDFTKSEVKAMELSLCALEVVLGIDGLKVKSEDDVFDFILKWGRAHYPKVKERQSFLTKRLAHFIHFSCMSSHKLDEALKSRGDFYHAQLSELVLDALHLNTGSPYDKVITSRGLVTKRVYEYRPIKVVHVHESVVCGQGPESTIRPRCVVYFNLKKDECANLFPSKNLRSQSFQLGERWFYLMAQSKMESPHNFGLFVYRPKDSTDCTIAFELAVMNKSSKDFIRKLKLNNHTLGTIGWGMPNLLGISWTDFMSDENDYFIDDILHLRVEITLIKPQV